MNQSIDTRADTEKPCSCGLEPRRRVYAKPQLIVYGNVADLTAGNNGTIADPGHVTPTKLGAG
jgi:hypothetical protein